MQKWNYFPFKFKNKPYIYDIYCIIRLKKSYMNIKIIEKSLLPLFLATLTVVGFTWQFPKIYAFLIEHFTSEKLSMLYSHLFIYTFLILTIFIFLITLVNHFTVKSKVFVAVSALSILFFYIASYNTLENILNYFVSFALSQNAVMGMVIFVVGTFSFALYVVGSALFRSFVPLSHSLIFTLLAILYSAFFIDQYCYPIFEIMTKF